MTLIIKGELTHPDRPPDPDRPRPPPPTPPDPPPPPEEGGYIATPVSNKNPSVVYMTCGRGFRGGASSSPPPSRRAPTATTGFAHENPRPDS
jgi:hypothetical protein